MFYTFEILGTIVFALSGALTASRKRFDLSGVTLIAFAVGNGGGTIRDLLLGNTPVFWIQDINYIIVSILTGIVGFYIAEYIHVRRKALLIADALGLGIFAIAGAKIAMGQGYYGPIAAIMGCITAVGGGVIRDILCDEIPMILHRELYAIAAIMGSGAFVILYHLGVNSFFNASICVMLVFFARIAALTWEINLPKLRDIWKEAQKSED